MDEPTVAARQQAQCERMAWMPWLYHRAKPSVRAWAEPWQREIHARLTALEAVELSTGDRVPCDVLFAHPPQRQVELVRSLGLTLDDHGYVQVEAMKGETSTPGIFAAGDLTTRGQAAVLAASSSVVAATMINFELNSELASSGAL